MALWILPLAEIQHIPSSFRSFRDAAKQLPKKSSSLLVEGQGIYEHLIRSRHYTLAQESAKSCCAQGEVFKVRTQGHVVPIYSFLCPQQEIFWLEGSSCPTLWGLWDKEIQEVLCTVFPNLLRLSLALLSGQRHFEPVLSQRAMVKNSTNNKYPPIGKQLLGNYYGRVLGQGVLDCYLNTHTSCDLEWPAQRLSTPFNEAHFVYPFS